MRILNYGSEVWGFHKSATIERVHLQFCKKTMGVKQSTQNDFIYDELGRIDYQSLGYINIIKFWLKIVSAGKRKYIKCIYDTTTKAELGVTSKIIAKSIRFYGCLVFPRGWRYQ